MFEDHCAIVAIDIEAFYESNDQAVIVEASGDLNLAWPAAVLSFSKLDGNEPARILSGVLFHLAFPTFGQAFDKGLAILQFRNGRFGLQMVGSDAGRGKVALLLVVSLNFFRKKCSRLGVVRNRCYISCVQCLSIASPCESVRSFGSPDLDCLNLPSSLQIWNPVH